MNIIFSKAKKLKSYQLQAGFTLVEIVIVVGVLLLMSGLLMIYTQKGGKQIALYRDHAALNQQLLRARGFSTAKVRPEDELVCAYGIEIANNGKSYTVFKDLPSGSSCPGDFVYQFPDEKIDTISTDPLVTISNATVSTIVFTPGLTAVYFDGVKALPGDEARIPVRLDLTTQKMTIVINYLGQMFTE